MGLLKKIFGGGTEGAQRPGSASSQFHESETTVERDTSPNAPRRELVQVVLRDTMRKHGIPSDWMECRILSVVTRKHKSGMHVQFIVRQGEDRLLPYVHPFQDTFWEELEKFEPKPREWLFSIAWQFDGEGSAPRPGALAGMEGWEDDTQPPEEEEARARAPDTQPYEAHPDEIESDLQALYAAMSQPAELANLPPTPPAKQGPGRS
jgi:hypothetical protein